MSQNLFPLIINIENMHINPSTICTKQLNASIIKSIYILGCAL